MLQTKTVELRGSDQENLIAHVRTQRGNERLVVDLGPASRMQKSDIKEDANIAVEGVVARVGDRQFLVASRVKKDGEVIQIDRADQRMTHELKGRPQQAGQQQPTQQNERQQQPMQQNEPQQRPQPMQQNEPQQRPQPMQQNERQERMQ